MAFYVKLKGLCSSCELRAGRGRCRVQALHLPASRRAEVWVGAGGPGSMGSTTHGPLAWATWGSVENVAWKEGLRPSSGQTQGPKPREHAHSCLLTRNWLGAAAVNSGVRPSCHLQTSPGAPGHAGQLWGRASNSSSFLLCSKPLNRMSQPTTQ